MNIKSILGTVGVAAALVLGVVNLQKGNPTIEVTVPPSNPTPVQVVNKVDVPSVTNNVAPSRVTLEVPKQLGSVTGPDFYGPYMANNDVKHYAQRKTFAFTQGNGTTTPCAFKLPSATSTPTLAGISLTTSTSSAMTLTIATSTNAFATTTAMATVIIPAATTQEYVWEAGTIAGGTRGAMPNTYIVFGLQGPAASGTTGVVVSGSCFYEAVAF